jgi:hypothetical protein
MRRTADTIACDRAVVLDAAGSIAAAVGRATADEVAIHVRKNERQVQLTWCAGLREAS